MALSVLTGRSGDSVRGGAKEASPNHERRADQRQIFPIESLPNCDKLKYPKNEASLWRPVRLCECLVSLRRMRVSIDTAGSSRIAVALAAEVRTCL